MDVSLSFGEWLEDHLAQRRWSQAVFADAVGVARQTVSNWINNTRPPRRRAARDIARVLEVDVNEVLVRAGYPPMDPDYRLPEEREPLDLPASRGQSGHRGHWGDRPGHARINGDGR